jgi:hypothetical protein
LLKQTDAMKKHAKDDGVRLDLFTWNRLAKTELDDLRIEDSIGTQFMQYVTLSLNLALGSLFVQTCIRRLKIRPTLPKSSKYLIKLAIMRTSFASFKWLANIFGNRESTRSRRIRMPRPVTCMSRRTSLV